MEKRFSVPEKRINELEKTTASLAAYITISSVFQKITGHLQKIEKDLAVLTAKVEALDTTTGTSFKDVKGSLEDIKAEISKINDVTGYEDIFKNQIFSRPEAQA